MSNTTNHLDSLPPWSETAARRVAEQDGLELSPNHLEILETARHFYNLYGFSPSMRPLIKTVADRLSIEKARSIYLMQLFPPSPAKRVAKYAGLPAPKNCI